MNYCLYHFNLRYFVKRINTLHQTLMIDVKAMFYDTETESDKLS